MKKSPEAKPPTVSPDTVLLESLLLKISLLVNVHTYSTTWLPQQRLLTDIHRLPYFALQIWLSETQKPGPQTSGTFRKPATVQLMES